MSECIHGDALQMLRERFGDESVQCCITSPPYWGLRDYKVEGQMGLEKTPEEYVAKLVDVFWEVRRVLKPDGTLWLNLGDCYHSGNRGGYRNDNHRWENCPLQSQAKGSHLETVSPNRLPQVGLEDKDLVGIPWRVAFALQADGWYLRCDIIWSKPNPMPESVKDRPTKAHEYLFLLSKSERYYYDADAIKEPGIAGAIDYKTPDGWDTSVGEGHGSFHKNGREKGFKKLSETQANIRKKRDKQRGHGRRHDGFNDRWDAMEKTEQCSGMRNKRSVWTIATQPYPEAHFATFPEKLVEPCVLAGCPVGGRVLDPFAGSGTVLAVAKHLGRHAVGIELNAESIKLAERRLTQEVLPLTPGTAAPHGG